jgi:hypothetical protein
MLKQALVDLEVLRNQLESDRQSPNGPASAA